MAATCSSMTIRAFENRGSAIFGCVPTRARWMSAATTSRAGIVLDLKAILRPVDLPNPNVAGAFDVGAFERLDLAAMFANGFRMNAISDLCRQAFTVSRQFPFG
jgi:hypothetical protein